MRINRMVGTGAILGLALLGSAVPVYAGAMSPSSSSVAFSEPSAGPSSDPSGDPSPDPSGTAEPSPDPTESPEFVFDEGKVTFSPVTIEPGGKVTITVICPTSVTAVSEAFVQNPTFGKAEDGAFVGTATYKSALPDVLRLTITCADHGSVIFVAEKEGGTLKPAGRTGPIPAGAPDTGDGSTIPAGGSLLLIAGGAAIALAAAGMGAGVLRRRGSRQEQSE